MPGKTKRIFISDIHMGNQRSMEGTNPYCWFKKNVEILASFLDEQLRSADVKEVVILGDLFDQWVIPTNVAPLNSYADICSNPVNAPVIKMLQDLAGSKEVKLSYVPGNHDMSMNAGGIPATKQFLDATFPGIRFFCNSNVPLGTYSVGTLAAEHGDRYCLFNAPDTWTAQNTFLPLGYFISRMVAYKFSTKGMQEDYRVILEKFLKDFLKRPDFIEDLLAAIARDAGLTPDSKLKLQGIPGFNTAAYSVGDIGKRYQYLSKNWDNTPGHIDLPTAIIGDIGTLSFAASKAYFHQMQSNVDIVIFGHTHIPTMTKIPFNVLDPEQSCEDGKVACRQIYANCGAWVDTAKEGCTYVETEEAAGAKRHYVRIKKYSTIASERAVLSEGFVGM